MKIKRKGMRKDEREGVREQKKIGNVGLNRRRMKETKEKEEEKEVKRGEWRTRKRRKMKRIH